MTKLKNVILDCKPALLESINKIPSISCFFILIFVYIKYYGEGFSKTIALAYIKKIITLDILSNYMRHKIFCQCVE